MVTIELLPLQVLCSTVQGDKIICGCQYGILVIWDLADLMESPRY